jgi:hypothetical protein
MENVAKLEKNAAVLDSLQNAGNDSLLAIESVKQAKLNEGLTSFLNGYVFKSEDPIVTIFAMANAPTEDKSVIEKRVEHLTKKFPKHKGVQDIILAYNKFLMEMNKPKPTQPVKPVVGNFAPDFTMNDTEGKPVSLSQYKGKKAYLLVNVASHLLANKKVSLQLPLMYLKRQNSISLQLVKSHLSLPSCPLLLAIQRLMFHLLLDAPLDLHSV